MGTMTKEGPAKVLTPPEAHLVVIDYEDVVKDPSDSHSLASLLEEAFGVGSIGAIAIRNVPGFVQQKQAFLPMAHPLAHLPSSYLEDQLVDAASLYNNGWSHGKEKMGTSGKPDLAKGSFYFNPLTDTPGTSQDREKYPLSYPCNVWPTEKLPDFEPAAKSLGSLLKDVTVLLSKHIDAYAASKVDNYPPNCLYDSMKETEKAKGRLLYYFPLDTHGNVQDGDNDGDGDDTNDAPPPSTPPAVDSWIGWHNDSGFLTALAGDMYVDHATGQALPECPDPRAGLYVVDRQKQVRRVAIPPDCLAIQIGECLQILTGGAVVATPHCVRGAAVPGVARISFPCFIDTPPTYPLRMPEGRTRQQVLVNESDKVPSLDKRWTHNGMTFGDFLTKTFGMYYEWTTKTTSSH